ncbi:MAG: hypothetical protein HeimC2_39510 [Candidatus Heimdallarchaeota archaeon LC_2]|nr:MAG: hypothetical protein HeimC2_39510 [Candidatus Heimdallarchaeota archaeon LC_2]
MYFQKFIDLLNRNIQQEIESRITSSNMSTDERLLLSVFNELQNGKYKASLEFSDQLLQSKDPKFEYIGLVLKIRSLFFIQHGSGLELLLEKAENIYQSNTFEHDKLIEFLHTIWLNLEINVKNKNLLLNDETALPPRLEYLQQMMEVGYLDGIIGAANNLKMAYDGLGEYDESKKYLQIMKEIIDKEVSQSRNYSYYYNQLFLTLLLNDEMGSIEEIIPEWEKSVEGLSNYEQSFYLWLVSFFRYLQDDKIELRLIVDKLKELTKDENLEYYEQLSNLVEASYHLLYPRAKNQVQAQELLESIVYTDIIDPDIYFWALNFILIVLFNDLSNSGDLGILDEIHAVTEKLTNHAEDMRTNFPRMVAYLMKAKISIVDGNFDSYLNFIESAEEVIQGKNAKSHEKFLNQIKASIFEDVEKMSKWIEDGVSIQNRLKQLSYNEYVENVLKLSFSPA